MQGIVRIKRTLGQSITIELDVIEADHRLPNSVKIKCNKDKYANYFEQGKIKQGTFLIADIRAGNGSYDALLIAVPANTEYVQEKIKAHKKHKEQQHTQHQEKQLRNTTAESATHSTTPKVSKPQETQADKKTRATPASKVQREHSPVQHVSTTSMQRKPVGNAEAKHSATKTQDASARDRSKTVSTQRSVGQSGAETSKQVQDKNKPTTVTHKSAQEHAQTRHKQHESHTTVKQNLEQKAEAKKTVESSLPSLDDFELPYPTPVDSTANTPPMLQPVQEEAESAGDSGKTSERKHETAPSVEQTAVSKNTEWQSHKLTAVEAEKQVHTGSPLLSKLVMSTTAEERSKEYPQGELSAQQVQESDKKQSEQSEHGKQNTQADPRKQRTKQTHRAQHRGGEQVEQVEQTTVMTTKNREYVLNKLDKKIAIHKRARFKDKKQGNRFNK